MAKLPRLAARTLALGAVVVALFVGSVAPGRIALAGGAVAAAQAIAKDTVVVVTTSGRHSFTVEWAVTEAQREKGLMFRKSMPIDHGMLFDFGREQMVDFWMRNTPLPLDMIFIAADGTVKRVAKNAKPYSDDVIPGGAPVRYVLEVNGGVAERIGLAAGDKVRIPAS